ncbi:MAG: hypothetical protein PVI51_04420 [candidate division WOR-3 bacterium]|jgi:uncharacterized membrane protein YraQ (UPF0718 family)
MKKPGTKTRGGWLFLLGVILVYVIVLLVNPALFSKSMGFFARIFLQILPIFALVFVLMTLSNLFIDRPVIVQYFKRPGIGKWFFVIVAGIVSTGPLYVWYPLLAELRDKGVGYGYLAAFLYNRAIKVPLLPVAIFYFGLKYIVVLTVLMIVFSVIQGIFINRIIPAEH